LRIEHRLSSRVEFQTRRCSILAICTLILLFFSFEVEVELLRLWGSKFGGFYFCVGLFDFGFLDEVGFNFLRCGRLVRKFNS
jgi:hypothetical protein